MTREKYLELMAQLGKEPNEEEIPPSMEDLPIAAQEAINIFNALGNRLYPEIGYTGKDYTNLPLLLSYCATSDNDFVVEIILWLDAQAITKSNKKLEKAYEKLKRSSSK